MLIYESHGEKKHNSKKIPNKNKNRKSDGSLLAAHSENSIFSSPGVWGTLWTPLIVGKNSNSQRVAVLPGGQAQSEFRRDSFR